VPATFPASVRLPPEVARQAWTNFTNFNVPRIAPYFWVGAKYTITPQLDVTGAYYYLQQTNFNAAACTTINTTLTEPDGRKFTITTPSSNKCAGTEDAFSALIDYRPVKRVDLYAGIMVSNVYAGLANGFQAFQNIAPTAGLRIKF
jgi:predicted porin